MMALFTVNVVIRSIYEDPTGPLAFWWFAG
jgi:hypothetical protein